MTRAQFIKNLGIFGTLLTVMGYKQALAIKDSDDVNVTNSTIFDLEFYSDRMGPKYNCEILVNRINDYYRSNKRPNKEQICESGRYFNQQFHQLTKKMYQIEIGKVKVTKKEFENICENYICASLLVAKSKLLLGNGHEATSNITAIQSLFIDLNKFNAGKVNKFPKGYVPKLQPYVYKELGEMWLKVDSFKSNSIHYLDKVVYDYVKIFPKDEKRLRITLAELRMNLYEFNNESVRESARVAINKALLK
jgi:hypothetical protein